MIILDTNHLSALRQGGRRATRFSHKLATVELDQDLAVTMITVEEVAQGWINKIHQAPTNSLAVAPYDRLYWFLTALNDWLVLPFDAAAATQSDVLRQTGVRRVGLKDLRIAAIALTYDALLLSANRRDFRPSARIASRGLARRRLAQGASYV